MEGVCCSKRSSSSLILILLFFVYLSSDGVIARKVPKLQLEGIQRYLEKINKTPLRSIKSPDGDIIDCVPIDKQPAFDHPLLKNHKIQRVPPRLPMFENKRDPENYTGRVAWQAWNEVGNCPEGTVAIRRTTMDDVLRAKSLDEFGKKEANHFDKILVEVPTQSTNETTSVIGSKSANSNGHEYALVRTTGEFYGAKATINVWNPHVEFYNEFSLSQIWVYAGHDSDLNTIEAGWQVFPKLYGDRNTRLFGYWSTNSYRKGCYNLVCSGFVHTTNKLAFGAVITPLSSYVGKQFEIEILIAKDSKTGNWWLNFKGGVESVFLGYWPGSLFTSLKDQPARGVDFGAEVINKQNNGKHTSTQMGSGHFAEEGLGKSSYFHSLQVADSDNVLGPVTSMTDVVGNKDCYNVNSGESYGSWRTYFFYGGPGRNLNCP